MNLLVHDIQQEPSKGNVAASFYAQTREDHEINNINKDTFQESI